MVPAAAIDTSGESPTATRVKDGVVERVSVQAGVEDAASELVEVVSGLAPGDTVLLRNARALPPGTRVAVAEGEPPRRGRVTGHRRRLRARPSRAGRRSADVHVDLRLRDQEAHLTIVVMLALVVFGVVALFMLETDEFPEVDAAGRRRRRSRTRARRPTASSARSSTRSRRRSPASAASTRCTSTSLDGFATIIVEFDFEKDLQRRRRTSATRSPRSATTCRRRWRSRSSRGSIRHDLPIVSLTLSSDDAVAGRADAARRSGHHAASCAASPASPTSTSSGGIERELTVELRPDALQAAGRRASARSCRRCRPQNLAAPVGRVTGDARRAHDPPARPARAGPAEFEQLVVAERGGRIVRLGEVADVRDGTEEPRTRGALRRQAGGRHRHQEGDGLQHDRGGRARCAREVEELQQTLPAGRRRSTSCATPASRVEQLGRATCEDALIEGALLTVLVVFLFLNSWRSTVITGLALPVSVLASFVAVLGVRLHAQHDVAARPVAGHRHPDRRRDRGAREHRAPRRDGEGPLHRRARRHRRDRPGRGGDDVLDRRRVRADRVHGRHRRAVVRARSR